MCAPLVELRHPLVALGEIKKVGFFFPKTEENVNGQD